MFMHPSPLPPPPNSLFSSPLSLSLPVSLTSSSSPQKHSFVRLSRFPAEVCGLRNPLQSGPLSGAVPAVGEACFFKKKKKKGPSVDLLSSTERGRPDGYLSFSERPAQRGPSRPTKTCCPLSHSPTLAHLFPLPVCVISISFAYLFPVWSFLVVCCS